MELHAYRHKQYKDLYLCIKNNYEDASWDIPRREWVGIGSLEDSILTIKDKPLIEAFFNGDKVIKHPIQREYVDDDGFHGTLWKTIVAGPDDFELVTFKED